MAEESGERAPSLLGIYAKHFLIDGWQPIETAPKDGTHILIWCPIEERIVSSYWISPWDWKAQVADISQGAWYGTDPMDRLNWIQHPTHWMPMPAAPIAPQVEGAA